MTDRFVVTEPGYQAVNHGMPAHYQIKYRRDGVHEHHPTSNTIHVTGPYARINIHSVDNSSNESNHQIADFSSLIPEFSKLRQALISNAHIADHYLAIAAIATAEEAAKDGDSSKFRNSLQKLGPAVKWVLDVAKQIGIPVATELLKSQIIKS